jgi:hypothetical protein
MKGTHQYLFLRAGIEREAIDEVMLELGLVLINVIRASSDRPGQLVGRTSSGTTTVQFVDDQRLGLYYAIAAGGDSVEVANALRQRLSNPDAEVEPRRRLAIAALSKDEDTAVELLDEILQSPQLADRAFGCVAASYLGCARIQRIAQHASLREANAQLRVALNALASKITTSEEP